jgi:aminoglycoside 6'-N-acetyltransferase
VVVLRAMSEGDLPLVLAWLRQPRVAQWWTPDTSAEAEIIKYRARIVESRPTKMLTATVQGRAIGWGQWYRWADYPAAADAMQALDGECGIDYAIGDDTDVGHGLGTELVAALVLEARRSTGRVGLLVAPNADNAASRRVLEKNGFQLVSIRAVATEPSEALMALYRLAP